MLAGALVQAARCLVRAHEIGQRLGRAKRGFGGCDETAMMRNDQAISSYPSLHRVMAFDVAGGAVTAVIDTGGMELRDPRGMALLPDGATIRSPAAGRKTSSFSSAAPIGRYGSCAGTRRSSGTATFRSAEGCSGHPLA